jgi:hypothetical protein
MFLLSKLVYETTGKQSYILIDEYDKLLMDTRDEEEYAEVQEYETGLLMSVFKDNPYLKNGLMTGVTRISHEGMLSGLNNLQTFDVFNDATYTTDYGFTEEDIDELGRLYDFDKAELRKWYNGIRIKGTPIYNTYSVMSYLESKTYDNFWGKSGTMKMIQEMLTPARRVVLAQLLNEQYVSVPVNSRISLKELKNDASFYSLLIQAGYLAISEVIDDENVSVSVPNVELNKAWKEFILTQTENSENLLTMLDNVGDLNRLETDIQGYLQDSLSYYDIGAVRFKGTKKSAETEEGREPTEAENKAANAANEKIREATYHVFILGIMSAYRDIHFVKPTSNRESGDGRYDISFLRPQTNFIFEFKSCADPKDLTKNARLALDQIDTKRYYADFPQDKTLLKIGIAFSGKQVDVRCAEHVF